jgi:predicted nucleic acid-binding protein
MERVVFDTNLYIDWIDTGLHEDIIIEKPLVRYMNTVVLLELRAGAFTPATIDAVERLRSTFTRTRRILSPTAETFWQTGEILQALQQRFGYDIKKQFRLVNDCLIALSSRQLGATVYTRNRRDFEAIQQVSPFKLSVIR